MLRLLDYAVEIFFIWLAYKVIFSFIIPIYQSTKQFRKQAHEVQQQMQDQNRQQQSSAVPTPHPAGGSTEKEGEYIEFEELRKP